MATHNSGDDGEMQAYNRYVQKICSDLKCPTGGHVQFVKAELSPRDKEKRIELVACCPEFASLCDAQLMLSFPKEPS
ncbi:MAG: hypothetical protein P4L46_06380 [Fimbriimonas sp.]|nr:hypothetical protein [Fimbriimonas sp.]